MEKLEKANELLLQIVKRYPNISPVSLDDYDLFQSFFAKEKQHTYGNTWTYVTQGVYGLGPNNLGYKYYDGENLSMLATYPKILEPETIMFYWSRPMGETVLEKIVNISGDIKKKYNLSTHVKKIFPEQADKLKRLGLKDISTYPWYPSVHSEDDTFPELIIDVKNTISLFDNASRRRNIRHSYLRAQKIVSENHVSVSDKNIKEDGWKVIEQFFIEKETYKKEILSTKYDYHNMIFNNVGNQNLVRNVVYINSVPMAFYATDISVDGYTNAYANIVLRGKIPYLSDLVLTQMITNTNTKFLNMGGSEDESIHRFKLKYVPVQVNQMYWVTNN
ncbi:MAG TPA: hypothetical protein PK957_00320 [Candidatus Dojkabacteria bacterium]|nr:hypothetical protein [Candidatus Dojkabacteria bacterium]